MLGDSTPSNPEWSQRSLISQMAAFGLFGEVEPVQAVAFTVRSALPLGDVVRGIYEVHGVPAPKFIAIYGSAGRHRLSQELQRSLAPKAPTSGNLDDTLKKEQAYVSEQLEGRDSVVVIDEFSKSGDTLAGCRLILRDVGVEDCRLVYGNWYHSAPPEVRPERETFSSTLAGEMQQIGRLCYKRYLETIVPAN